MRAAEAGGAVGEFERTGVGGGTARDFSTTKAAPGALRSTGAVGPAALRDAKDAVLSSGAAAWLGEKRTTTTYVYGGVRESNCEQDSHEM